ncbi:uncharacterized protein LOC114934423 [Nylanderia fulva]|uniref:uncharacterized protein LOC114934423 n=1 Tax=Nylanderia fulva TaxID=613905 RepID=UPI0010FAD21D|nr:uncharacterized protein LOC114934423 [Nylanderia fulva]
MAELRNLLISQVETIDSIKRVLVNFKKLAKANVTLAKTQGRLATLETLWTSCRGLHVKLLQATTSEEQKTVSYFLNGDFLSAEEIYHDTADLLRDTISRFSINQSPLLEHSTDSSIREGIHNHNFQLPRISLPKFSGKFSEWESFKNTFESLVASNDSLSNTQKFHYLKTSVISDAASIISNLKISDANYESVWQLLIDEYDDQLTLIHTHIHAFMCLPTMKAENVAEMRKLRDTVSASLAALTNLKRPGLSLAYPDPSSRHQIHMLIGADVYGSLLLRDLRQGPYGAPTAQSTSFGWIISGPTGSKETTSQEVTVLNCVSALDVDSLLQKFWEDKEIPTPTSLTEEEEKCESHFAQTHSRDPDGRYVVRLLFKNALPIDIGESLSIARTLYGRLENKLNSKSDLCSLYRDFLTEYEALGHMTRVGESEPTENIPIYIPHHPVIREDSCTTKLRVVFNASCKTRNGTSLNDHLLIGPKLQQDLPAVLLLTYGLASAPYLSMRVLRQLALDEGAKFPAAVPIVNDSIYVDDALFGANDIDSLINTRTQLAELMRRGGFLLRKWASNCSELLDDLSSDRSDVTDHLILKDETLKIFGLSWLPTEDSFRLTVKFNFPTALTKRSILSCIASLYDPLGWAAPVVINAKIILQELWLLHCDWDAPLPNELSQRWNAFASEFPQLESVRIPRWTGPSPDNLALEIHGFADASNRAYAAVVYLRVFHSLSEYRVSLIVAKSKVAPVKTVSIPRLELNAVVLLSRLVKWVIKSLNIIHCPIHCWTDSTIALAWLRQHPSKWTTYVANRVSEVQCNLPSAKWNHVPSKDNPADCASRGLYASKLVSHPLWWAGPPWLQWPSTAWPPHNIASPISTELTKQIHSESRKSTVLHVEGTPEWDLPYRYSSWTKLIRVTAYAYRFISRSAKQRNFEVNVALSLNADELKRAEMFWLSYTQRKSFDSELKALKREENFRERAH